VSGFEEPRGEGRPAGCVWAGRGAAHRSDRDAAFIQRISHDHPEWGEDKIAEEFAAKFAICHSASTIRRYMVPRDRTPRGDQTWRTFIRNHSRDVWACDSLTQYTALFAIAYVFVVMEIHSRRIVHVNVTANPTLSWVKQQIREATDWGQNPRFLVHDNDGIFGQFGTPLKVERDGKTRSYRCHLDCHLPDRRPHPPGRQRAHSVLQPRPSFAGNPRHP
jgi:hypothetical protein